MEPLANFRLLHEGLDADIFILERRGNKVLKVLKTLTPTTWVLQRLINEWELAREDIKGMRRVYGKEMFQDRQALLMEYVPGKSWRKLLADGPWGLATFLPLALEAARTLEHIHEAGLVHREVSPDHVLIRSEGQEAVFIGFGGAIRRDKIDQQQDNISDDLRGDNLVYMAPELF